MDQSHTKQNIRQAVPFFMVNNMKASLQFYVEGLGFTMAMQWTPHDTIEWCMLQRESVSLMLQEYRKEFRPVDKLGIGVSTCFICEDALALYHEFLERGLTPAEPFVGNKMWVVSLKDPDGYDLQFESMTEVPEETSYAEWSKAK